MPPGGETRRTYHRAVLERQAANELEGPLPKALLERFRSAGGKIAKDPSGNGGAQAAVDNDQASSYGELGTDIESVMKASARARERALDLIAAAARDAGQGDVLRDIEDLPQTAGGKDG